MIISIILTWTMIQLMNIIRVVMYVRIINIKITIIAIKFKTTKN